MVLGAVCMFVVIVGDALAGLDVGRGELYQAVAILAANAHAGRAELAQCHAYLDGAESADGGAEALEHIAGGEELAAFALDG